MDLHPATIKKLRDELSVKERTYRHYCNSGGYDALARLTLSLQIKELRRALDAI